MLILILIQRLLSLVQVTQINSILLANSILILKESKWSIILLLEILWVKKYMQEKVNFPEMLSM